MRRLDIAALIVGATLAVSAVGGGPRDRPTCRKPRKRTVVSPRGISPPFTAADPTAAPCDAAAQPVQDGPGQQCCAVARRAASVDQPAGSASNR